MKAKMGASQLQKELTAMLRGKFDGMSVVVEHSARWKRMCVRFIWPGFAGLLPEERFHRLASSIPEDFRESRLKGFVWIEATPDESIGDVLAMPRSEDVVDCEAEIYERLEKIDFFSALKGCMEPEPQRSCTGGFSQTQSVLSNKKAGEAQARDAKLLFILHGAYCDCQVVQAVHAELAKRHA